MNWATISTILTENTWIFVIILAAALFYTGKNKAPKESENSLISSILSNNVTALAGLLEGSAVSPNVKSSGGKTAMELAITRGNRYMVGYLLKHGAIPTAKEIQTAEKRGNPHMIRLVTTGDYENVLKEYCR
ncbi:hypothetical protein GKZ89_16570 [Bacillus mangrovi]|uniref:Ankyrin repeat domain-containing protein n=1 Tax=Metabacillus mangrovi TaxID=1491830 RepID=A0A7X2V6A8_9BACI|nr:hypothetical protein [Metabacillus mangrovi]MTH55019.1 hypothetical protein [Metabacillus mangrovi]